MAKVEVRPLQPSDDRRAFCSGNPDLDRYFVCHAGQNQFKHHLGITYVAVEADRIVGFATVSASHIEVAALPEKRRRRLPAYPLPILRLARLAVDQSVQGRGIGLILLRAVFQLAHEMSQRVGCVGVVVDAKPKAVPFHERYGFRAMDTTRGRLSDRPEPVPMFLPIAAIPKEAER